MCLYFPAYINKAYIRDKQTNFPLRIKINELCLLSKILHKIILILNYMNMYSFANCHLAWRIQSVTHLRCALYIAYMAWVAALPCIVYANLLGRIPTICLFLCGVYLRVCYLCVRMLTYACMSCTEVIVSS